MLKQNIQQQPVQQQPSPNLQAPPSHQQPQQQTTPPPQPQAQPQQTQPINQSGMDSALILAKMLLDDKMRARVYSDPGLLFDLCCSLGLEKRQVCTFLWLLDLCYLPCVFRTMLQNLTQPHL